MNIPRVPLDPTQAYRYETLKAYPIEERKAWEKGYERYQAEQRKAAAQAVQTQAEMQSPAVEREPSGPGEGADLVMAPPVPPPRQIIPARQVAEASSAVAVRQSRPSTHLGDKKIVLQGYKENSLCSTLVSDALQRAYMAMELLDKEHAKIVRARLAKAGITNSNASHVGEKDITFRKAVSIASQAEQWVYQAQAAAAKSMAKHSKSCAHNLSGRPKLTVAKKEARYRKRYGVDRGTRTERAVRKHQKKIAEMTAE